MSTATRTAFTGSIDKHVSSYNEHILDAGRQAGNAFLDAYERTFDSIAPEKVATEHTGDNEFLTGLLEVQARYARDLSRLSVSAGRELLK